MLVTAGPTHEAIDPVRYIGNHSSGKMGFAIAEEFASQGAEVILVTGPVDITTSRPGINIIRVVSAAEMHETCLKKFPEVKIAVLSAAVADFSPEITYSNKMKRGEDDLILKLKPTKDIAAGLGKIKTKDQFLAGFALETQNELENAKKKLMKKNLDMIVLNSLRDTGAGFQHETNKITIIDKNNNIDFFELKSKKNVAVDIVKKITDIAGL